MKCANCGAPMIQLILSMVCSAECDLKLDIKLKPTLEQPPGDTVRYFVGLLDFSKEVAAPEYQRQSCDPEGGFVHFPTAASNWGSVTHLGWATSMSGQFFSIIRLVNTTYINVGDIASVYCELTVSP
jgi:hypothetical protein